jgi:hypothetical protein
MALFPPRRVFCTASVRASTPKSFQDNPSHKGGPWPAACGRYCVQLKLGFGVGQMKRVDLLLACIVFLHGSSPLFGGTSDPQPQPRSPAPEGPRATEAYSENSSEKKCG